MIKGVFLGINIIMFLLLLGIIISTAAFGTTLSRFKKRKTLSPKVQQKILYTQVKVNNVIKIIIYIIIFHILLAIAGGVLYALDIDNLHQTTTLIINLCNLIAVILYYVIRNIMIKLDKEAFNYFYSHVRVESIEYQDLILNDGTPVTGFIVHYIYQNGNTGSVSKGDINYVSQLQSGDIIIITGSGDNKRIVN